MAYIQVLVTQMGDRDRNLARGVSWLSFGFCRHVESEPVMETFSVSPSLFLSFCVSQIKKKIYTCISTS